MSSSSESRDDIDPILIEALKKGHVTDEKSWLMVPSPEIQRQTGLSNKDVCLVKNVVAQRLSHRKLVTALDILQGQAYSCLQLWKLPTNCQVINDVLRGGLLSGTVTEICGESGSGKSQFCLQLCLSVQTSKHKSGGAVYICSDSVFPSKRLQQLIKHNSPAGCKLNFGDSIFVEHVANLEALDFCLRRKVPALLSKGQVGLVVIDSVTTLFRCQYDLTQMVERAQHLTQFACLLQCLAFQHNIPIVCVNQVSANMLAEDKTVIPALGLTWANQVTCRLMLSRPEDIQRHMKEWSQGKRTHSNLSYRKLEVVFAPHLPQTEISFYIDEAGIHGI